MNVLDMLQEYLRQWQPSFNAQAWQEDTNMPSPPLPQNWDAITQALAAQQAQQRAALPPGLPDVVVRSILGQPNYGEGEPLPRTEQQQMGLPFGPQRDARLRQELAMARAFRQGNRVMSDSAYPGSMFGNQPNYGSPLNQFMPGAPLY